MGFVKKNELEVHESLEEICVLDFETTGLKAGADRAIEIGICVIKNNSIADKFQTLINPGVHVPEEITGITGITNQMLVDAPSPEEVMVEARRFIKSRPLMAHNASFDKRFLDAEMDFVDRKVDNPWICTLMLSRRLLDMENHKLPTLAQEFQITATGAHRALADVVITAQLWNHLYKKVVELSGIEKPDRALFEKIAKTPKKRVIEFIVAYGEKVRGER